VVLDFFSVVVVGVGTTLSVFGPILSSFLYLCCVVIIADILYLDYYLLRYSCISLVI